jgi:hypothetical protein
MEVEVVCLANPTQELAIEANHAQEPEAEANFAHEPVIEIIKVQSAIVQTSQMFPIANMLLLPILPTRRTRGTKPLVDYSKSHVVTSDQYLGILCQEVMQKEVVDKEREIRR